MTPNLAQLRPILRDLGMAEPIALAEMAGGSNAVYRIDLTDGSSLILKTYDEVRGKAPDGEAYAAELLKRLNLPVTRYLVRDESRTRLSYRFALTNYLPGVAVATYRDDPDVASVYREMGALLRRLHTIRLPAFGHFDAGGIHNPVADNATYMRVAAAHAFAQFRKFGVASALADRLEHIVTTNADLFAQTRGAVFAHDDFHTNNVLADRTADGRLHLIGLIDFGNARAADAVFDLAKTLFMADHDAPGASPHIRAGYGHIDHPEPEAVLWLYTLLHRVVMWWWLRHVGTIGNRGPSDLMIDLEAMAEQGGPARPVAPTQVLPLNV